MSIPTLAEHLAGKVEIAPGPASSCVHLLGDERPIKKSDARRGDTGKKRKARASSEAPAPSSTTSTAAPRKRRKREGEQLPPRAAGEARFGVFEDGTVHLATEGCKGTLSPDEALDLLHFVEKLAAAGWIRAREKGAAKA